MSFAGSPILVNFDSRGVTAVAPRGDFGSLRALKKLAVQSELGAVAWWVVGIGAAVWWDMRLAYKHSCFGLVNQCPVGHFLLTG